MAFLLEPCIPVKDTEIRIVTDPWSGYDAASGAGMASAVKPHGVAGAVFADVNANVVGAAGSDQIDQSDISRLQLVVTDGAKVCGFNECSCRGPVGDVCISTLLETPGYKAGTVQGSGQVFSGAGVDAVHIVRRVSYQRAAFDNDILPAFVKICRPGG